MYQIMMVHLRERGQGREGGREGGKKIAAWSLQSVRHNSHFRLVALPEYTWVRDLFGWEATKVVTSSQTGPRTQGTH